MKATKEQQDKFLSEMELAVNSRKSNKSNIENTMIGKQLGIISKK